MLLDKVSARGRRLVELRYINIYAYTWKENINRIQSIFGPVLWREKEDEKKATSERRRPNRGCRGNYRLSVMNAIFFLPFFFEWFACLIPSSGLLVGGHFSEVRSSKSVGSVTTLQSRLFIFFVLFKTV